MRRRVLCFSAMALFAVSAAAPSGEARDDWELWTELRWKAALSERLTLQGASVARYRGDMGTWYRHFDEIGLGYRALPWLAAEGAYHWNANDRPGTHDNLYEHRIYAGLAPQVTLAGFRVEHRHRMEFRHLNGLDDWRYRSRLKVSRTLGKARWWELQPFAADELFYGFRAGEWTRNRVTLGAGKPLSKRLAVEVFYILESNRAGRDWGEFHGLGLATTMAF